MVRCLQVSTVVGVKPYLCDTCGQSFTGISMLSKHKLMKHKPKHLSCPHCDYKTSLQTWMKDHMKRHSSETPFICQFCSYAAKTAGRLKVSHLNIWILNVFSKTYLSIHFVYIINNPGSPQPGGEGGNPLCLSNPPYLYLVKK